MAKNPRPAKAVLALIVKYQKPVPPIPPPPLAGVIPAESLWERFRRRRRSS
jgi:hypothetical protein